MLNLPASFRKPTSQAIHVVAVPLAFLAFVLIYRPFNLAEQLQLGRFSFGVNLTLIACIIFGSMLLMRTVFHFVRNRIDRLTYYFWCLLEITISALFAALYVWLMARCADPYFMVVARVYGWLFPILIFPYVITAMALFLVDRYRMPVAEPEEDQKMRFYDDRNNLKLVVSVADVLAISAEENYIKVHYLAEGKLKSYLVRSSMKSIEDVCLQKGLVRCHRSYMVNVMKINHIKKGGKARYIVLTNDEIKPIPVSKSYFKNLIEKIDKYNNSASSSAAAAVVAPSTDEVALADAE